MRVPEKHLTAVLGLARSTLRTRRARGQLARRGSAAMPTETKGARVHALVDSAEALRPLETPRDIVRCGVGLIRVRDARGRIRTATLAERAAWREANPGRCCDYHDALRAPAELEVPRTAADEPEDTDDVPRAQRVL